MGVVVVQLALLLGMMVLILWPNIANGGTSNNISVAHFCNDNCGGIDIPYPFGMGDPYCYVDEWFEIECNTTTTHDHDDIKPILKKLNLEVRKIDARLSTIEIMNPIYRQICDKQGYLLSGRVINMRESPFVYSHEDNRFVGVGCNTISLLHSYYDDTDIGGCVSICDDNNNKNNKNQQEQQEKELLANCNSRYCCETSLPEYLAEYNVTMDNQAIRSKEKGDSEYYCSSGYALIATTDWVYPTYDYDYYNDTRSYNESFRHLKNLSFAPAVLDWMIMSYNYSELRFGNTSSRSCYHTTVKSPTYNNSGFKCSCNLGFRGNAYLAFYGSNCSEIPYYFGAVGSKRKLVIVVGVSSTVGSILFLIGLWWLYKFLRRRQKQKLKERYFRQNGGLLLNQKLSSDKNSSFDKTKLFNSKDLEKATEILGKGGQGTVYKGMLVDGQIVAVKMFKVKGNVEDFINEVVILSQINHRNVVNLLGFCLETEDPLLVYEFIPNGTLSQYLHEQNDDLPMTWEIRLRIANEVAGALFYLHSAASQPIYHRDIKSTNILLDEKYKAKIADFGTSRMVSIEATHITTNVQGTFGYLDPEYYYTSQFTEKSDVYSFGVVLVERLTGQKPICPMRSEAKSLASYFIICMEEDRLFDIIDKRIMEGGEKEEMVAVANIAKRCLELKGRKRPTMREVTMELEGIQKLGKRGDVEQNHEEVEFDGIEAYNQSWLVDSTSTKSTLDTEASSSSGVLPLIP